MKTNYSFAAFYVFQQIPVSHTKKKEKKGIWLLLQMTQIAMKVTFKDLGNTAQQT